VKYEYLKRLSIRAGNDFGGRQNFPLLRRNPTLTTVIQFFSSGKDASECFLSFAVGNLTLLLKHEDCPEISLQMIKINLPPEPLRNCEVTRSTNARIIYNSHCSTSQPVSRLTAMGAGVATEGSPRVSPDSGDNIPHART